MTMTSRDAWIRFAAALASRPGQLVTPESAVPAIADALVAELTKRYPEPPTDAELDAELDARIDERFDNIDRALVAHEREMMTVLGRLEKKS
jgi:hypothetical protein